MNIGPRGEGDDLDCAWGSVNGDCQTEALNRGGEQDSNEGTGDVEDGLAAEV